MWEAFTGRVYHQYSRYAPLEPNISRGVMDLSQILMNRAVEEL